MRIWMCPNVYSVHKCIQWCIYTRTQHMFDKCIWRATECHEMRKCYHINSIQLLLLFCGDSFCSLSLISPNTPITQLLEIHFGVGAVNTSKSKRVSVVVFVGINVRSQIRYPHTTCVPLRFILVMILLINVNYNIAHHIKTANGNRQYRFWSPCTMQKETRKRKNIKLL